MFKADQRRSKRARTAISRADLSRPLKLATGDGMVGSTAQILDYGFGRGDAGRVF